MTTHRASLAFTLLAFALVAYGADFSGKWQWQTMASGGRVQYTLTLKQDGESLTGVLGSEGDEMAIRDGKVNGDKISFAVTRKWGTREMTMTYTGRLAGDEIRFKVLMPGAERSWDVTAKRAP